MCVVAAATWKCIKGMKRDREREWEVKQKKKTHQSPTIYMYKVKTLFNLIPEQDNNRW